MTRKYIKSGKYSKTKEYGKCFSTLPVGTILRSTTTLGGGYSKAMITDDFNLEDAHTGGTLSKDYTKDGKAVYFMAAKDYAKGYFQDFVEGKFKVIKLGEEKKVQEPKPIMMRELTDEELIKEVKTRFGQEIVVDDKLENFYVTGIQKLFDAWEAGAKVYITSGKIENWTYNVTYTEEKGNAYLKIDVCTGGDKKFKQAFIRALKSSMRK